MLALLAALEADATTPVADVATPVADDLAVTDEAAEAAGTEPLAADDLAEPEETVEALAVAAAVDTAAIPLPAVIVTG